MTRGDFGARLLERLDAPHTVHNRRAIQTWMQSEGGSARNNPLNTTLHTSHSSRYNFADVQNYETPQEGLDATVRTFGTPGQGYGRIVHALRTNQPARETVKIIGETNWGTAQTLMAEVREWVARVDWVLRWLERKEIAS